METHGLSVFLRKKFILHNGVAIVLLLILHKEVLMKIRNWLGEVMDREETKEAAAYGLGYGIGFGIAYVGILAVAVIASYIAPSDQA